VLPNSCDIPEIDPNVPPLQGGMSIVTKTKSPGGGVIVATDEEMEVPEL